VAVTVRREGARDKEEGFFNKGLSVKKQEQLIMSVCQWTEAQVPMEKEPEEEEEPA